MAKSQQDERPLPLHESVREGGFYKSPDGKSWVDANGVAIPKDEVAEYEEKQERQEELRKAFPGPTPVGAGAASFNTPEFHAAVAAAVLAAQSVTKAPAAGGATPPAGNAK